MASASEIVISIVGKNSGLKKTLDDSTRQVKGFGAEVEKSSRQVSAFGNIVQGVFQGIGQAAFNAAARGFGALLAEIPKAIHAASDLSETMSKTATVFGDATTEVLAWSKESATAFGLSQQAALEATSSIGNMFIQMGEGQEQAAGMSSLMVELAADIASFNNVAGGAEAVLADMQSAFRGEYDPIQKYIPLINAATVEQQALAESGKETAKQLTALDKALAVQTLVMQGAGAAVGDFERTIAGVANQERILAAQMENFSATLGQAFTPIYGEILRGLNQLVGRVSDYGGGIVQALATGMVNGIIYLLPAIRAISDIIEYWFAPGSPPRIAPNIDTWMTETINEWLSGAAKADFGVLKDLGSSLEGILRSYASTGAIEEGDLVGMIFGSQAAIARAIVEWKTLGGVTEKTLDEIRRSAGPAGNSIAGLVKQYLAVESAAENVERAQRRLNDITEKYNRILDPIRGELGENQAQQQLIRDRQRIAELQEEIADTETTADEKRLAQLEIEEIQLRKRESAVERKQGAEEEAAQLEIDRAKAVEDAAQLELDRQQAILDAQGKVNALLAEEQRIRQQQLDEAERLHQAQLAYNLLISDSEGDIRLLKEELGRYTEGSAEYLAILGQIHGAEEQLRGEQEAAAAQRAAEQEAAQRAAEQAANEAERLAKEAARVADQLYQAQLNYNLQVADTPGKIALLKQELSKYTEGSVEYWQILTQIAGLEAQLAREREKAGGTGLLGGVENILGDAGKLEVAPWVQELTDKLRTAFDEILGTGEPLSQSIGPGLLGDIGEGSSISQDIKDFVQNIKDLTTEIAALVDLLNGDGTELFNKWADNSIAKTKQAAEDSGRHLTGWELDTRTHIQMMQGYMDNGWVGVWDAYVTGLTEGLAEGNLNAVEKWGVFRGLLPTGPDGEPTQSDSPLANLAIAGGAIVANIATGLSKGWLTGLLPGFVANLVGLRALLPGSEPADTSSPLYGLSNAGTAFVDNFWDGFRERWQQFLDWWMPTLQAFRDLLPFSEPKDPSSPLYGLGKAGESIINQIQGGMERAALTISPTIAANLAGVGASTTNNATTSNSWGPIQLHFHGNVTEAQARTAANTLQNELRRRGAPV